MFQAGSCSTRCGRISSSSSQNPAESSAHNASLPDELWAQRDQPALEDIK